MPTKKKKEIDLENLTPEDEMKLEIAEEIGVLDKVLKGGSEEYLEQEIEKRKHKKRKHLRKNS